MSNLPCNDLQYSTKVVFNKENVAPICFGPCFRHFSPFACRLKRSVRFFENIGAVTPDVFPIFLPTNIHIYEVCSERNIPYFVLYFHPHPPHPLPPTPTPIHPHQPPPPPRHPPTPTPTSDVEVPPGAHSWILFVSKFYRFVVFCTFFNKVCDLTNQLLWYETRFFFWFMAYILQIHQTVRDDVETGNKLQFDFPISLFHWHY